ncbi:MAG: branched-chain amino acid ABC transporter substrate-binding protein [bacterium]
MKKGLFLAILVVLAGCCPPKKEGNVVKIALVCPLTGDLAAMGQGMKRGAEMAVSEANKTLTRFKFELVSFDDRADPKEAVNVAAQIISDPNIYGVVGHLNSGCSIPASSVYAKKNLIMISPASTNPKLTLQGLPNVFRVCTTDDVQGSFGADFLINKLNIKNVAIIHDKTAYGQGLAEEFKKRFEENKGVILSFDGINIADKDFKALLISIKDKKPGAIYFGGVYGEGGLISKQAKELGLNVPLIGGDGLFSPEYIKIAGNAAEGNFVTMVGVGIENLQEAQGFLERFKNKYPDVESQPYDHYTYEAANIIISAISNSGLDNLKVINWVKNVNYQGILGETKFDEKGDTLNKAISVYKVEGEKFVLIKE